MVYCKKFDDGSECVVHAPDNIPKDILETVLKMGRREILKKQKMRKLKITLFAISAFCAAAVSAIFIIGRKLKMKKV